LFPIICIRKTKWQSLTSKERQTIFYNNFLPFKYC
jgi:hypothetical protein